MWNVLVLVVGLMTTGALGQTALEQDDHLSWLLESPAASGLVLRRITPKSVFVAPSFCSEGFRTDSAGRCVKVVRVNPQAQWDFLLQKLNSMYAAPVVPTKVDKPTGPLHLPIPIAAGGVEDEEEETTTTATTEAATSTTADPPATTTEPPPTSTPAEDWTTEEEDPASTTERPATTTDEPLSTTEEVATTTVGCGPAVSASRVTDPDYLVLDCVPVPTAVSVASTVLPAVGTAPPPALVRFPADKNYVRFPDRRRPPAWWPQSWAVPSSYRRYHNYPHQFWHTRNWS